MNTIRKLSKLFAAAIVAIGTACSVKAQTTEAAFAEAVFRIDCEPASQPAFELGVALLHENVFRLAAKSFQEVVIRDPSCAMGFWGAAIVNMGDVRLSGPSPRQLADGAAAVTRAKALGGKTERECDLIDAVAEYYHRHQERAHATRLHQYENAMRRAQERFPEDREIAALHARAFEALITH